MIRRIGAASLAMLAQVFLVDCAVTVGEVAGRPVPWLLETYGETETVEVRAAIVRELGSQRDPTLLPHLLQFAEASDPEIRFTATRALADLGTVADPTRDQGLLMLMADPDARVRQAARDALATLEYTFAAIESYEEGGVLVRPNALPLLKHIAVEREH